LAFFISFQIVGSTWFGSTYWFNQREAGCDEAFLFLYGMHGRRGARGMNKKKGKMSTVVCFVAEEATRDVFGPSRKTEHLINPLLHCKHTMAKPCSLCLVALLCAVSSQVGVFAGFTGSHQRKRPTAARRFDRQTSSSVVSSLPGDERDNHERQQQRFIAPLDLSPIYDDRKPRRPWSKVDNQEADHRADWGVSKEEEITDQEFPSTAVAVIDPAFTRPRNWSQVSPATPFLEVFLITDPLVGSVIPEEWEWNLTALSICSQATITCHRNELLGDYHSC
jgi:hypothetical protein